MKKYIVCLVLFLVASVGCTAAGYYITREQIKKEEAIPNATLESETVPEQVTVAESEEARPAVNKEAVNQYYLVNEDGFLLVFCKDKSTICLYTHVPVTDFPEEERARLMEGIWFSSMLDVFNYLESYTS